MKIGIGNCDVRAKHGVLANLDQLGGADRPTGNPDAIRNSDLRPGTQGSEYHRMVHTKSSGEARRDHGYISAKTNGTSRENLHDWSSNRIDTSSPTSARAGENQ
jgi:hypothetical protein